MEAMKTMIHDQDLPMHSWAKATRTSLYVQNKISYTALGFKTPKDMFTRKKPKVSHPKIFGCLLFVYIPKEKRTKLDPSEKKGIFVGYCEVSKAFRIYIPGYHHMKISRDVPFDEDVALKKSRNCQLEEVYEEVVTPKVAEPMEEVALSPNDEILKDHDMLEPQKPPHMRRYGALEGSTRQSKKPNPFPNYVALMCDLVDT